MYGYRHQTRILATTLSILFSAVFANTTYTSEFFTCVWSQEAQQLQCDIQLQEGLEFTEPVQDQIFPYQARARFICAPIEGTEILSQDGRQLAGLSIVLIATPKHQVNTLSYRVFCKNTYIKPSNPQKTQTCASDHKETCDLSVAPLDMTQGSTPTVLNQTANRIVLAFPTQAFGG